MSSCGQDRKVSTTLLTKGNVLLRTSSITLIFKVPEDASYHTNVHEKSGERAASDAQDLPLVSRSPPIGISNKTYNGNTNK